MARPPFEPTDTDRDNVKAMAGSRHPLQVYVYGDSSGHSPQTSASRTDWQIVRDFFKRYPERFTPVFRLRTSHPPVKDRVACVNAKLLNFAGERHLKIDPSCKLLIEDLE